jgi:hypothetical protein
MTRNKGYVIVFSPISFSQFFFSAKKRVQQGSRCVLSHFDVMKSLSENGELKRENDKLKDEVDRLRKDAGVVNLEKLNH